MIEALTNMLKDAGPWIIGFGAVVAGLTAIWMVVLTVMMIRFMWNDGRKGREERERRKRIHERYSKVRK